MTNLQDCTAVSVIFFSWSLQPFPTCLGDAHCNTSLSGDKCKTGCNAAQLPKLLLKARSLQQKANCLFLALIQTLGCSVKALQAAGAVAFADLQAVRDTKYQNIQTGAQVLTFLLSLFFCTMGFSGDLD